VRRKNEEETGVGKTREGRSESRRGSCAEDNSKENMKVLVKKERIYGQRGGGGGEVEKERWGVAP